MKDERILDAEVGDVLPMLCTATGIYFESVIVQVTCPACGEYFKGIIRDAGGFVAGHQAYHEFTNAQDMLIHTMGGV